MLVRTLVACLITCAACSESTDPVASGGANGGGGQVEGGADPSGVDGGAGGGKPTVDPDVEVPPERLEATASEACPDGFVTDPPAGGQNVAFAVGAQSRSFYLTLPDLEAFSGPRPLFVWFHGTSTKGDSIDYIEADLLQRGFIGVGLDGKLNGDIWPTWDAMHEGASADVNNPDLALFDAAVACLAAHYEVDKNRVYIGGLSAGGIMTNYMLQRRSELLAGGIVGSGIFSLTQPEPAATLDPMAVIVTWGGDNDEYSGTTGGVTVPKFNFAEQAALASAHYEEAPGVHQVACHGDNIGHAFLTAINDWMLDFLLDHPKGLATNPGYTFTPPATSTEVACTENAATFTAGVQVICPDASDVADCQDVCQFTADCTVENASVAAVVDEQLTDLGFSGADHADCSNCVQGCEAAVDAGGVGDVGVASCIADARLAATCGPGIEGNAPWRDAMNACCEGKTSSKLCETFCEVILTNNLAASFFPACEPWK